MSATAAPVFLVPGTKHYSFPKAAAVLGKAARAPTLAELVRIPSAALPVGEPPLSTWAHRLPSSVTR